MGTRWPGPSWHSLRLSQCIGMLKKFVLGCAFPPPGCFWIQGQVHSTLNDFLGYFLKLRLRCCWAQRCNTSVHREKSILTPSLYLPSSSFEMRHATRDMHACIVSFVSFSTFSSLPRESPPPPRPLRLIITHQTQTVFGASQTMFQINPVGLGTI